MKKGILLLLLISISLTGCAKRVLPVDDSSNTELSIKEEIGTISGLDDVEVIVNHYFNPMMDVSVQSKTGKDISSLLSISGNVNYGAVGSYQLQYSMSYGEDTLLETRTVNVVDGIYVSPTGNRPATINATVGMGNGSYLSGSSSSLEHPINPDYLSNNLKLDAIPSNGWWTSLLVANQGAGNGIYINPLRTSFTPQGLEVTNPGDGFVQFWNNNGNQTVAQFPLPLKDLFLNSTNLTSGYTTNVIDYGDASVKVSMRENGSDEDNMVISLVQGSPYVFAEIKDLNSAFITLDTYGNEGYKYYDIHGNEITTSTHTGDSLIVKMIRRHVGYDTSPPANVGAPEYADRYYLINVPSNTTFTLSTDSHPSGLLNKISMSLNSGNYISIAALNDMSEADFYHEHGYSFITDTATSFEIDYTNSIVNTSYNFVSQEMKNDNSAEAIMALMPHHYKNADVSLSQYSYRTVRGTLEIILGSRFETHLSFNGLVPGFTTPDNDEFSNSNMVSYLENLDTQTNLNDSDGFINSEVPYWNSKALYPLSQGVIIADQLGEEILRDSFIAKLTYLLEDWYTYSSSADERFLYYNNAWGTVYYSDNEFNTATELTDHSFTHGYLIYASSVLAMYSQTFVNEYSDMVDFLLDDYMFPEKDNANFAYLRNFDKWAGHSWAHGFATFAEGNNLESTSEALNSWNAGYLWALATNDQARMEAAIYGFTTELSSIKEYWFDYDEENWDPQLGDEVDVVGMIWGGKQDYATWFGANPTFIYGIQWLPTGEFLTSYALNDSEYARLTNIYNTYLDAKGGEIDTWYSNMWAIQSIINPDIALNQFDLNLILNDDYPAALSGSYWMVNSMKSLNRRSTQIWMEVNMGVSSTIYENDDGLTVAMIWNVSTENKTINFLDTTGVISTITVEAKSFTKVTVN